jgi:hypothetical protein
MEDKKRGMASPGLETPPLKNNADGENRVTVMILGGLGKVRSFRISPRIFIFALVFFLAFIFCAVLFINAYMNLRIRAGLLSQKIEAMEEQTEKDQKGLVRFKQHIDLLEDYIRTLEDQKESEAAPAKAPTGAQAEKTPPQEATPPQDTESEEITSALVDIKDLVIQKNLSRMRISFKLMNTTPGDEAVGGYYHIIARGDSPEQPQEWIYPQQELENGLPKNFKRGKVFLIQRFKPVYWGLEIPPGSDTPSVIMVLVYDQSGDLILKKSFAVNNEP